MNKDRIAKTIITDCIKCNKPYEIGICGALDRKLIPKLYVCISCRKTSI